MGEYSVSDKLSGEVMTTAAIPGLQGEAPTNNQELLNWIAEAVELFQPEAVVFADGSQEE